MRNRSQAIRPPASCRRRVCAGVLLALLSLAADWPAPKSTASSEPYPAVRIIRAEYERPRALKTWAIRVDLSNPNVELNTQPLGPAPEGYTVLSETTREFAEREGVQLAVNGGPFAPMRLRSGEPMNVTGLLLSRGRLISPPATKGDYGAILFGGDSRPTIRGYPIDPAEVAAARHGVGGFHLVVADGKNLRRGREGDNPPLHPRTAAGIADGGKTLWLLVVDGRQPGVSEGVTYTELGDWALSLGVTDLLNLDGGGSTTFVLRAPDTGAYEVVNTPIGKGVPGTLRSNADALGVRIYCGPNDLSAAQLTAIMPRLPVAKVPLFLGALNRAMAERGINTPARRAAFLAQLAHESGELRYMEEIASGEAYEGRANLGNTQPGDGKRFKGRGPIQLTGRANYRKAGEALGLNLEDRPEQVADPETGCRVAGWFWQTRGLNELADAGDFREITRRINGGFRHLDRREAYHATAKKVLGVDDAAKPPSP